MDGTLACYVVLTVIILTFIGIFVWNGSYRKLPTFVKVALPAYLVYAMYSGGVFVWMHTLAYEEQLSSFYDGTGQILLANTVMLFLLLHWQFAAHYNKSSVLF